MDYDPTEYKKLRVKRFPARAIKETTEGKYWAKFKDPVDIQQVGAVTSIDFCPTYPYPVAVSSSTRVLIYDSKARKQRRSLARFSDKAYSGSFRADGRSLVAGGEDGVVRIFDTGSRGLLRMLTGHQRPVHATRYAADKLHVFSGGDDATVRWWDVSEGKQLLRLDGHTDYIRSAANSPGSTDMWATGAYDHTCRLWDVRNSKDVLTLDHGAPIEDIAFFPAGTVVATAGGNDICLWDVVGGGRLLHRISSHQKTVTSICITPTAGPDSVSGPRLLSGSLDGHIKVFELDSYAMTYSYKFPDPVLCLGISRDASTLAVGLSSGKLSLRKHPRPTLAPPPGAVAARQTEGPRLTAANYRYFLRGRRDPAGPTDERIASQKRANLKPVDKLLRKFLYREALDSALSMKHPDVLVSLFDELAMRSGLGAAIGGRDSEALLPLLNFLFRNIVDVRYCSLLVGVADLVLDIYAPAYIDWMQLPLQSLIQWSHFMNAKAPLVKSTAQNKLRKLGTSAEVDDRIRRLQSVVHKEVKMQESLEELQGVLEPILATNMSSTNDVPRPGTPPLAVEGPQR